MQGLAHAAHALLACSRNSKPKGHMGESTQEYHDYQVYSLPVQRARKFSAVRGTTSARSCMSKKADQIAPITTSLMSQCQMHSIQAQSVVLKGTFSQHRMTDSCCNQHARRLLIFVRLIGKGSVGMGLYALVIQ